MFIIKKVYKKGGWTIQQVSSTWKEIKSSPKKFTTKKLIEFLTNIRATHIEEVSKLKNYKIEFWESADKLPLRYQYIQSLELSIDEVLNFLRIWSEKQDFTLEIK